MERGETLAAASNGHFEYLPVPVIRGIEAALKAKRAADETAQKKEEWDYQFSIFHDGPTIGSDYLEATGELPTCAVIDNLHYNGYSEYNSRHILESGVFYDWDDFLGFVMQKRADDIAGKNTEKEEILSEIREQILNGSLPFIFLAGFERYKSEERLQKKLKNNDMARLSGEFASDDELIKRYARYQIASELVVEKIDENGNKAPRNQPIELRRLNIALDVNTGPGKHSGKILNHTLVHEIAGSNSSLTSKADVTESDVYQKWYDVLHPEERQYYLNEIAEACLPRPEPEYYYDHQLSKVILVGRLALDGFSLGEEAEYLRWLDAKGLLSFAASQLSMYRERERNQVFRLMGLFSSPINHVDRPSDQRNRYEDLPKTGYKSYGYLLLKLANAVNGRTVNIGRDLNIGPGPWLIKNEYGSLPNYFEEVGQRKKVDRIDIWEPSYIEAYIQQVFTEYGEVNIPLLRKLYQERPLERPSVHALQRQIPGGLTTVLEDLELPPPPTKKKGVDWYRNEGVKLADSLGRLPKTKEIRKIASTQTIQKWFGSITSYRQEIYRAWQLELDLAA